MARKSRLSNAELKRRLPQTRSTIGPLPFYPELRRTLRWHGPAILLAYLEIHHPEITNPLLVDLRKIQVDLVVGRELFWTYFNPIGTVFQTPEDLWRAQRAGREFIRADHQLSGVWRCYSLTRIREDIYQLRRNAGLIQDLISTCSPTAQLGQHHELSAVPQTDNAPVDGNMRFSSFSLETNDEILGLGPKEAAARLAEEIGLNPDRRKLRKVGTNRAGGLTAAAKLTPAERIAKARKAALARHRKAKGDTDCASANITHQ